MGGINFLYDAVDVTQSVLLPSEMLLADFDDNHDQKKAHGNANQLHESELPADCEHHYYYTHNQSKRADELTQTLIQRLTYQVYVVGNAAQNVAETLSVKVRQGQLVYFVAQVVAHTPRDIDRYDGHDDGLYKIEQRACDVKHNQPDRNGAHSRHIYGNIGSERLYYFVADKLQNFGSEYGQHRAEHCEHQSDNYAYPVSL